MEKTRTYTAYGIGCFVVWAVIWAVVGTRADDKTRHQFLLCFLGWVMGWTSATIARAVYPPPRQRELPETVKWGLAVLTIGNLVLGGVKLFQLLRHPATERVHGPFDALLRLTRNPLPTANCALARTREAPTIRPRLPNPTVRRQLGRRLRPGPGR